MVVMMGSPGLMINVAEGVTNALAPAVPVLFSRQVQPPYICLPSEIVYELVNLRVGELLSFIKKPPPLDSLACHP